MNALKWTNLRVNKCPKCGSEFGPGENGIIKCPTGDFNISVSRMETIITSQNKNRFQKENQEDISNLYR